MIIYFHGYAITDAKERSGQRQLLRIPLGGSRHYQSYINNRKSICKSYKDNLVIIDGENKKEREYLIPETKSRSLWG